ncbi:MAG: hypothetical protein JEY99_09045 [Spirochaetales bacterium]|nr:hypothetical protein [Spirochaetales bacterium]
MDLKELNFYYNKFKFGEDNFHNLMQYRVKDILLVSTFYDAYIFEHDARLSEQIVGEYQQLNLTTVPRITSVPNAEEAINALKKSSFDLVITTMRSGEITPFELSLKVKEDFPDLPILLLLTVKSDITLIQDRNQALDGIDRVFLWNGDSKLFLAMIKYIEDMKNAPYDTENGLVRVILLVEDNIAFHSLYLPLLYTEIMEQTQRLISEENNDNNKYQRMRTRPKVLLAESVEEALEIFEKYREYLLCVISDVEFYNEGKLDPAAGIKLLEVFQEKDPTLPLSLQSSVKANEEKAKLLGVDFFHKKSPHLLTDLRHFILRRLGFGDFIFRNTEGEELARAENNLDFERILPDIPIECIMQHALRHDFSSWLIAHGEFQIARTLRQEDPDDFPDMIQFRKYLIKVFREARLEHNRGKLLGFDPSYLNQDDIIIRLGRGSLGGKGRGLAFTNALLVTTELASRFHDVDIRVPKTIIVGTSEFDHFLEKNNLYYVRNIFDDSKIQKYFLKADFSEKLRGRLKAVLEQVHYPLAVRSSGLLEDSQSQPFAGVYQTYMIPNSNPDIDIRLHELCDAIKLVYASVFLKDTRKYIEGLNYIIDEEKMGVIIQEVVGEAYGYHYYPHLSGVAQSYNYYPIGEMSHSDGVANLAIGLGHMVVSGQKTFRYSPRQPQIQYLSMEEQVKSSQTEFYALDISPKEIDLLNGEYAAMIKLSLPDAENDRTLYHLASVWNARDHRIEDGISGSGPRVVNFANILKYNYFPLSDILTEILDICQNALGVPVEIEFAVDLTKDRFSGKLPTFYLLQVRPLTINLDEVEFSLDDIDENELFLHTSKGLGNGVVEGLYDIIYVDPEKFDKTETLAMQQEIDSFNTNMKNENRKYILVGPGRWGSRDQFLGIPVIWAQISNAKVIIEHGLPDFEIEPSQGTHFLHNVIAMNVGYFNIPWQKREEGFIDHEWLKAQEVVSRGEYCVHARTANPMKIVMDGKNGCSVIFK